MTAQLIADLKNVKAEIKRRGWVRNQLVDWWPDDELGEDGEFAKEVFSSKEAMSASVCMTGAIGAAFDGADFVEYVVVSGEEIPDNWAWSPRATAVIDALMRFHPKVNDYVIQDDEDNLNNIVNINDHSEMTQRKILKWLDRAVKGVEAEMQATPDQKQPHIEHIKQNELVEAEPQKEFA